MTYPPHFTVLIVDDEPSIVTLLEAQLAAKFAVLTAGTAAAAKQILNEHSIDIILSGWPLPDTDGVQSLAWVQQHHPRIARVLLAGTARVEDAVNAINACYVHRIVLKPWRAEDLLATLQSLQQAIVHERSQEQLVKELKQSHLELEERGHERTRQLEQTMAQLKLKNQMLERMALTDPLTGAPNRRAIELIARKEILRLARVPQPLAFGLIDVDWFREINSKYLLGGGDHVLIWLVQTLQSAIRGTDALGRVGGEEFMVVAPATDEEGAFILAERLRIAVESSHAIYNGDEVRVTVSAGFAVAPAGSPVPYERLREVATAALKDAKTAGRNRSIVRVVL